MPPMKLARILIAPLLLLACFAPTPAHARQDEPPTLDAARRLLDQGRYGRAIAAYREILAVEPRNGNAWYLLAYCLHQEGELAASVAASETALDVGGPRASILYNLACTHEVAGEPERAEQCLTAAIEAGYLDFDQIAADPELAGLRARGKVALPEAHAFATFRGRNGVELPYELLLPDGYDARRAYPAVVLFAPGGVLSASWFLDRLCGGDTRAQDCLVLLIAPPEQGWWTHPTHHALEDLLKHVRKEHALVGAYHLVGFAEAGARPAATYSGMSGEFFDSLFVFGAQPFAGDDDDSLRRRKVASLYLLIGEEDAGALAEARRVVAATLKAGRKAQLRVLPDVKSGILRELHHGRWLHLVREELGLVKPD